MTERALGIFLLIGAVATATFLLLGIGSTDLVGQALLIATGTLIVSWFQLESKDGKLARFLRLVSVCYWCLAVALLATTLLYESVHYYVPPGEWKAFVQLSLFSIGTAFSYGFASFAVINRRAKWSWQKFAGLILAGYVSYWWNRDVNAVESLVVPAIMFSLAGFFKVGETAAAGLEPVVKQIPAIVAKLQQMGPSLMVFCIGYACIIVFFTGVYACVESWIPNSFGGSGLNIAVRGETIPDEGISRFLHLSVATGTTLGYGDIYPKQPFSRLLTSLQVIISLGWTVVVFVAAVETAKDRSTPSESEE